MALGLPGGPHPSRWRGAAVTLVGESEVDRRFDGETMGWPFAFTLGMWRWSEARPSCGSVVQGREVIWVGAPYRCT
jgi:hypothetical protein